MMKLFAIAALLLTSAARADWTPPTKTDVVLLAATEALIFVDMGQTIRGCNDPYAVMCESGLLLVVASAHPSTEEIVGWSVASMAATAALWYVLPNEWRKTFTITLGAVELLNCGSAAAKGLGLGWRF
jgi:hypothetical protein